MKIIVTEPEDLYEGYMDIELITDKYKKSVSFGSGEPEDMCLARDLNDAFEIEDMLQAAYNAGKDGESFEIEHIKGEEE